VKIPRWLDKILLAAGLALLAYVISQFSLTDIANSVRAMWPAVLLTPLIALCWFCTGTTALYLLLERGIGWWRLLWIRLVGDNYNALLPLAGLGGEPFKLRQLAATLPLPFVMSTFVRDRILDNVVGFTWSACGCIIGLASFDLDERVSVALTGYSAVAICIGVFGTTLVLTRLPGKLGRWLAKLLGDAAPEDIEPMSLARVFVVLFWYACSRALGLLEKVALLWALGAPHDLASAAFVDGFLAASGYISFLIPQGLGVFEGVTVYTLGIIGAPGGAGIAFALARRGRMLVVGLFGIALHLAAIARRRCA